MAVTISESPSLYTPSDNPIGWTFSSTQTAQPNFSFLVELYIDGVLDTTHKVFPDNGIYAHWDAAGMVMSKVPLVPIEATSIVSNASNFRAVHIKVIEFYGSTPARQASATSQVCYAFKASLSPEGIAGWVPQPFSAGNSSRRFLTDAPRFCRIYDSMTFNLQIIMNNLANMRLVVDLLDVDGNNVGTYNVSIGTLRIARFALGKDLLMSELGVSQATYDTVETVSVYVQRTTDNAPFSEKKGYTIDRSCGIRQGHVTWVNPYGAYDQFTYNHNVIQSGETSQKSYARQLGRWVGNSWVLDTSVSGEATYFKSTKDAATLYADWLSEEEQNFLVSFYDSSVTYLYFEDTLRRVSVDKSSYQEQQEESDELISENVLLRFSNSRNSVLS